MFVSPHILSTRMRSPDVLLYRRHFVQAKVHSSTPVVSRLSSASRLLTFEHPTTAKHTYIIASAYYDLRDKETTTYHQTTMPPTHCLNCDCLLGDDREIEEHLKSCHGIQLKLNANAHLPAYCSCCHKYIGHKGNPCPNKHHEVTDSERQRDWEDHLFKDHDIFLYKEPQDVSQSSSS
jgi:hypothetical protein